MVSLPFSRIGVMIAVGASLVGVRIAKGGVAQLLEPQKLELQTLGLNGLLMGIAGLMFACGYFARSYPQWSIVAAVGLEAVFLFVVWHRYCGRSWSAKAKASLILGSAVIGVGLFFMVVVSSLGFQ
jgi:hypothetical protein